jgi:hypothetical protein
MALRKAPPLARALAPLALALTWLALAPPAAPAQSSDGIHYTNQPGFRIPFHVDEGEQRIQAVLLHLSEDGGKTYSNVQSVTPGDREFRFTAPRDGSYYFVVQTRDTAGQYYPTNQNLASQPPLKVVVDTQKPVVKLRQVQPDAGSTAAVEWTIDDANLDLLTLQLQYQPQGRAEWVALRVNPLAHAQFSWTPAGGGPCQVRLVVRDKAGNQGEATLLVKPAAGGGAVAGPAPAGNVPVIHVPRRVFQLHYTIENQGPSGVKSVQVWETQDTRSWRLYDGNAPASGPFQVTVRVAGRYGYTVIPRSGVGLSDKAPEVGDLPQVWVVVDETKPVVQLVGVYVGRGADNGKLTIQWRASDPHLRAKPISLKYAEKADGPWKDMVTGAIENSGSYTVSTQELGLPYQFFVRVEAIDEAGNVGSDQTRDTVKVDTMIPRAGGVTVKVGDAPAAGP